MKTEKIIKQQQKHERESLKAYESILMKVKSPRHVYNMIELQNSRIELLDWILDQGDFK